MALQFLPPIEYTTHTGFKTEIPLSFQVFGQKLGSAPVVLVNHALTGNSQLSGENGWWKELVGDKKVIDTSLFTVLIFNIPGNGFDGFLIDNPQDFKVSDMANLFLLGLKKLGISKLYALIGGSLGGGIAWEMLAQAPDLTEHYIALATAWKSDEWIIGNCKIQELLLENSSQPLQDARAHAMLSYRTAESINSKFENTEYGVEGWLDYHGKVLEERFEWKAYRLMNQLLKTIDFTDGGKREIKQLIRSITAKIHLIGIDSDLLFVHSKHLEAQKIIQQNSNHSIGVISSIHGHDAFLLEFETLNN